MGLWLHEILAPIWNLDLCDLAPWYVIPMGLWYVIPNGTLAPGDFVPIGIRLKELDFFPMGFWPHGNLVQWEFGHETFAQCDLAPWDVGPMELWPHVKLVPWEFGPIGCWPHRTLAPQEFGPM